MNLFEICYHLKKQDEALKGSEIILVKTRKYPLHGYILGSGALGTPGVNP